jgi:ribonuclease P protein component
MLPRENRLNIRTEYNRIRSAGKRLHDPLFTLYYNLNADLSQPKFNLIVSKKITKTAARRNRMRRLLHTALSAVLSEIKPSFEGIFFIQQDFASEITSAVKQKVIALLSRGGFYDSR